MSQSKCYLRAIVAGKLIYDDRKRFLQAEDGTLFVVGNGDGYDLAEAMDFWEVVPQTTSSGAINKFQIVDRLAAAPDLASQLLACGQITQIAKNRQTVGLRIDLDGKKPVNITLRAPLGSMKMGEWWEVVCRWQGNYALIARGNPVNDDSIPLSDSLDSPASVPTIETKKAVRQILPNLQYDRFQQIAREALAERMPGIDWQWGKTIERGNLWEWEVLSPTTPQKARVQIDTSQPLERAICRISLSQRDIFISSLSAEPAELSNPEHLAVTPLGAARGIGASCFKVEIGPYEVVLDAGTRPKGSNPLPEFDLLDNPNLLLITHAHQDHIGALPVFHERFPTAPMYCTYGTREIAHVMLRDGLRVQQANEDTSALFDSDTLDRTLVNLDPQPMGVDFEPLPGLLVRFIHAGHIVGAACIYLRYGDRSLLYTGDYNTSSSRTADGLRLDELPTADILITESTYGSDAHPSRKSQETALMQAISEVISAGGNVLIPAFALGRAQEIILALRTNALFHSLSVPVYVDGLVRPVTDVFRDNLHLLPSSIQNFAKTGNRDPFFDRKNKPEIIAISSSQERPLAIAKPSIVIASSGMLTGGASVYYAKALLERKNATIFISGYTDEESPGRFLQTLEPGSEVELEGTKLTVRAAIRRFNLSAHADIIGLTQVIYRVNPRHLVLIHGSPNALQQLANTGELRDKYWIHIPSIGERISYGTPPAHLTNTQLEKIAAPQEYEITLEAEYDGAWLRLPAEMIADLRWQNLAATGYLKARWVKNSLVLQTIKTNDFNLLADIDKNDKCCANCQFYESSYCRCEDSSLYSLNVDPQAKCSEFFPSK